MPFLPTPSSAGVGGRHSVVEVPVGSLPERIDLGALRSLSADDVLDRLLERPVRAHDLGVLACIDPDELSTKKRQLDYSRRVDEVLACGAALQLRATSALAGTKSTEQLAAEVAVETEVSLARTISPTAAGLEIEAARTLATTFPDYLQALSQGRTTLAHIRRLVEATRMVTDAAALQVIGRKALRAACRLTPGKFADRLDSLIAEHDPDAAARWQRTLDSSRDVYVQHLRDGMGRLVYVDEWVKVAAAGNRIRSAGRATQRARRGAAGTCVAPQTAASSTSAEAGGPDAALEWATDAGSCRADAMLALTLGSDTVEGVVLDPADTIRVEVEVVIDLETLRGEADHAALLDGHPVPAQVGRDWARQARTFRRMVTDPVTGHLLDKGHQYLADDVRDFVLTRDGGCRIPTCGIRHRDRLQVDHAVPYPDGPTSAANLGGIDTTHHQCKTAGHLAITDSAADGSAVLTTAWGQRIVIPPRPYLHEPDPPEPDPADRPAERPPAAPTPAPHDDVPPF